VYLFQFSPTEIRVDWGKGDGSDGILVGEI